MPTSSSSAWWRASKRVWKGGPRGLADKALRYLLWVDLEREAMAASLDRLRRLVRLEPFDPQLHRWLMTVCLACGRHSEAVRRFKLLKAGFREEFGEDLDFELSDLGSPGAIDALRAELAPEAVTPT
jgi:hypothetical protein